MQTEPKTRGFTVGKKVNRTRRMSCDQCQVMVINGIPCHEHGCPNQVFECKGCWALVKRAGSCCADCG